jgi:chitinase
MVRFLTFHPIFSLTLLTGIDLDWEYPNSPGAGNPYSANDSANLLALLKSLRSGLGTIS